MPSGVTAAMTAVPTHCPYCALQCGMSLTGRRGAVPPVEVAARDFPTNRGGLCQKGWTAAELLTAAERLTTPLARATAAAGRCAPASWDEALDRVATGMRAIQAEHGRDAVAVFGGGGLTNEKAYQLGKFARVALRHRQHRLQRPVLHVVGRGGRQPRVRHRPRAAVPARRPRERGRGAAGRRQRRRDHAAVRAATSTSSASAAGLIVVDPRRRPTGAPRATLHLQPTPGTDLALGLGLLHMLDRRGPASTTDVHRRAHDRLRRGPRVGGRLVARAGRADHRRAGRRCGASARTASLGAGAAAGRIVLTARGAEQHTKGTDTVSACINLALALGPARPARAPATAA